MDVQRNPVAWVTLLLAGVAGYCDTATFVAGKEIFSAHVTGNFIVFAYQLVKGADATALIKLITFPVFVLAVITGGKLANATGRKYRLLLVEGILLVLSGLAVMVLQLTGLYAAGWDMYVCIMMVVFAMGIQNAFGKLFAKETYGPTTMMTGNVTQASLDLGDWLSLSAPRHGEAYGSLRKQLVTIGGFLGGCLLGAIAGQQLGLTAVAFPGIALLVCYFTTPAAEAGR